MGCCSSTPERESQSEIISPQQQQQQQPQQQQQQQESHETAGNIKNKKKHDIEVTITRPSCSSLNSEHGEKPLGQEENIDNEKQSIETWPIFVRLSSNGQDIKIEAPIEAPYLTIGGLQQHLIPHLKTTNVKLIYLGRILTNKQTIVPTVTDEDVPLPPPKNNTIQIQKNGVIQAMVVS